VLAEYLDREAANTAAALYCGTYVLINIAYNLLWHTATHHRLVCAQVPAVHIRKIRTAYRLTLPIYVVAAALALFHAFAGLVVCSVVWGVWAFLNYRPTD
jgi:TMEM175 potassium channel family protein